MKAYEPGGIYGRLGRFVTHGAARAPAGYGYRLLAHHVLHRMISGINVAEGRTAVIQPASI